MIGPICLARSMQVSACLVSHPSPSLVALSCLRTFLRASIRPLFLFLPLSFSFFLSLYLSSSPSHKALLFPFLPLVPSREVCSLSRGCELYPSSCLFLLLSFSLLVFLSSCLSLSIIRSTHVQSFVNAMMQCKYHCIIANTSAMYLLTLVSLQPNC